MSNDAPDLPPSDERDRLLVALSCPTLPADLAAHAWAETYDRIAPTVAAIKDEAAEAARNEVVPAYAAFDRGYRLGRGHGVEALAERFIAEADASTLGEWRDAVDLLTRLADTIRTDSA